MNDMSNVNVGTYTDDKRVNGTDVYMGGQPASRIVKSCGMKMMIRCHSCKWHRVEVDEKKQDVHFCAKVVTDEGYGMEIDDYQTTRCCYWLPNQKWVDAINAASSNTKPLRVIVPEDHVQKQIEFAEKQMAKRQARKAAKAAKVAADAAEHEVEEENAIVGE